MQFPCPATGPTRYGEAGPAARTISHKGRPLKRFAPASSVDYRRAGRRPPPGEKAESAPPRRSADVVRQAAPLSGLWGTVPGAGGLGSACNAQARPDASVAGCTPGNGTETMAELDYRSYWDGAFSWDDYLGREVVKHAELWKAVYRRAVVPEWAREEAARLPGEWRVLVISEDWCGDASNTVPVIARLAEAAPGMEMRVAKRDERPELMDGHLTAGARSIPLAVVLDAGFRPVGRWGPRPAALQEFVLREKRAGLRPAEEIYRDVRGWYARDRGESTVREVLAVIEGAVAARR